MLRKFILAVALAGACIGSAHATEISFSDRASWSSQVDIANTVGFEGILPNNQSSLSKGYSSTIGGVNFSASGIMYVIDGSYVYPGSGTNFGLGSGAVLFEYQSAISAAFQTAVTALGFDLRGYTESVTNFVITLSNGASFSKTVNNPAGGFFGIVSDVALTGFTIASTSPTPYVILDNVSYGNSAAVPEPVTLTLLGAGLMGVGIARRRKSA